MHEDKEKIILTFADGTPFEICEVTEPLTIKDVIFNPPATIVFWSDRTKTVVKAHDDGEYDPEKGLAMAFSKKFLGNNYEYYNEFKHWLKQYNKQIEETNDDIKNFLEIIRAIGRANPLEVITKELTNDEKDGDS